MCSFEDLPYDIEISKYGHYELEIKSGTSLSAAQNKLSKDIPLSETVISENYNRKEVTNFE